MLARPLVLSAALVLSLAACATPAQSAEDSGLVQVVASTNVYGNVAESIGGEFVSVTSIINDASQDPHSFEASARDQLAVSKADLIIENGGGYDPFVDTLIAASGTTAEVVNAVEASGLLGDDEHAEDEHADDAADDAADEHADDATDEADEHAEDADGHADHIEGFNEHVWYSFHGMGKVAEHIAEELTELDPANAATFESNLAAFTAELEGLETRAAEISALSAGAGVAITEPVPLYLLDEAGLVNKTPEAFSEAIEEGTDVPPIALADTLALFDDGAVVVLAYNDQTASPETEQVRDAADAAGVTTVSFTETLPDGTDYVSWMADNLEAIAAALP